MGLSCVLGAVMRLRWPVTDAEIGWVLVAAVILASCLGMLWVSLKTGEAP